MKRAYLIPIAIIFVLFVGCQPAEKSKGNSNEDVDAIKKTIYEPHSSIIAAGDTERWLENFSDDVVYMPTNQATLRGKDAVRRWAQEFNQFELREDIAIEKISVSGDLAFSLFTYSFHGVPKSGGKAIHQNGRIIQILERQDDASWKITFHISSSEIP
jgi:ketosteroid isomerase-like protein